uniref:Uncharacterized protein n=1 Tax=Oryza punctata TaxID=4537 RepID=A0A0E0L059_ORYPU
MGREEQRLGKGSPTMSGGGDGSDGSPAQLGGGQMWWAPWPAAVVIRDGDATALRVEAVRGGVATSSQAAGGGDGDGGPRGGWRGVGFTGFAEGGAGVGRGSQGRSVSPCRVGRRLWQVAAGGGSGLVMRATRPALPGAASALQTPVGGFADGGSNGRVVVPLRRHACRERDRPAALGWWQGAAASGWPWRAVRTAPGRGRASGREASALPQLFIGGRSGRGGANGSVSRWIGSGGR